MRIALTLLLGFTLGCGELAWAQESDEASTTGLSAPDAGPSVETLEGYLNQRVRVFRSDGSEIPGKLLGVTEQSLTLVKDDGRILSIRRGDVESVELMAEPVTGSPVSTLPPAPGPTPVGVPRPMDERRLVGASYTGQYFDLFDSAGVSNPPRDAFYSGAAFRYYHFVDADGRRMSQSRGWMLMGQPQEFRRLSGNSVVVPLQASSTVLGIAGLLCAISPNWQRATIPLTLASIGVGVTASSLRPVFQRRRGRIGLERAQAYFGPQPVAP